MKELIISDMELFVKQIAEKLQLFLRPWVKLELDYIKKNLCRIIEELGN